MPDNDNTTERNGDVDERIDNIARVVKDYLREGDSFLIQCQDNDIVVEEAPHANFQKEHPRLYGRLLSLNDQLETGCAVTLFLFVTGGAFCLALHVGWLDELLTANVADKLKTWWFYVPLFAALFFVGDWFQGWLARCAYRRGRRELLDLIRDEGFDRDTLVPLIKSVPEFERIAAQLKLDPGPFRIDAP